MLKKLALGLITSAALAISVNAQTIATDNADNTAYDDGWQNDTDNGGTGYQPWANLEASGGGQFLTTTRQVDGARSFSIFAGTGGYAEARPLDAAVSLAVYTVTARFDLTNDVGFSGFNLKSASGATFGANELLSFGMTPASGNQAIAVFGSANQTINFGHEIRGDVIQLSVSFDTNAGTFSLTASDITNGGSGTVTGNLKASSSDVAVLGFGNFNSDTQTNGGNQNLVFDSPELTAVPEPSSLALLGGPAILGAWFFIRRRRA